MADVYDRKQQPYGYDAEKADARYSDATPPSHYEVQVVEGHEEETKRSLKPRQISMIAIGGAIGECRTIFSSFVVVGWVWSVGPGKAVWCLCAAARCVYGGSGSMMACGW